MYKRQKLDFGKGSFAQLGRQTLVYDDERILGGLDSVSYTHLYRYTGAEALFAGTEATIDINFLRLQSDG